MRLRSVLIATMLACLALAACGDAENSADDQPQTSERGGASEEVTGPIVDIDSEGLGDVRSFTVKSGDQTYEILIDPHIDYGFPLSHLSEHLVSGEPVRVDLVRRGGNVYAQSIVDA